MEVLTIALIVATVWGALSVVVALVIGRMIAVRDRREAPRPAVSGMRGTSARC